RIFDHLARIGSLIGASLPVFWLGLLLLGSFYYRLRWLPGPGRLDISAIPPPPRTGLLLIDSALAGDGAVFWSALRHLVLPGLTLGLFSTAVIARMTRSAMLEVLYQDYIRTARAKGLAGARVVLRHALRNAMIPTLTIVGISFGNLLSGAVLTETVFAWPGLTVRDHVRDQPGLPGRDGSDHRRRGHLHHDQSRHRPALCAAGSTRAV